MDKKSPLTILIAEDDDAAAQLIKTNIKRTGVNATCIRAKDGQEVIEIALNQSEEKKVDLESKLLIMMDIRMPKVDGVQALKFFKTREELKSIPIIMMTTSDRPTEVAECYKDGCCLYLKKQVDYKKFVTSIQHLINFIEICELPTYGELINEQ